MSRAIGSIWGLPRMAGFLSAGHTDDGSRERNVLQTSDLDLARLAARGDHAAFHELVDRHAKALFQVAISLSSTRSDAEDLVQETFAAAYKGLPAFDGRASVRTWMTRILMRRAADAWRSGRHARKAVNLDAAPPPARESSEAAVDQRLDLAAVLQQLDENHREVIVLREMQGLSYAQIAQTLGLPQGTVESRLHRARAELRHRLKGYGYFARRTGNSDQ